MFSENTFTFESGKNGTTNDLVEQVYRYVTDRIEEIKYNTKVVQTVPRTEERGKQENGRKDQRDVEENIKRENDKKIRHECEDKEEFEHPSVKIIQKEYIDVVCPQCKEELSFWNDTKDAQCPFCGCSIEL